MHHALLAVPFLALLVAAAAIDVKLRIVPNRLLAPALVRPGALGMGDVKLAVAMGLYLGASVIPALMVAFLGGAVAGAALLLRHGPRARHAALPFAPFLALGGVVGLACGPELVALYLGRS